MKHPITCPTPPGVSRLAPPALAFALCTLLATEGSHGQTTEVGGAATIGDSTLTTTLGVANLPATGANWKAPGGNGITFSSLMSPSVAVTTTGAVTLTFTHRYDFENTWDGGAVYVNVNNTGFVKVPLASFTSNGYNGAAVASVWAAGDDIFTGTSTNYAVPTLITSVADLGSLTAGDTVVVEFRGGWDANTNGASPNWEIGTVNIVDTANTLLNANFTPNGTSGFTSSFTGTGNSPWQYTPSNTHRFELDAATDTADRYKPDIAGSVINLNGAKLQVALLNGTLASGDVFTLFDLSGGTTLTGTISSISLPPGTGIWNTSNLVTNGTITLTTAFVPADGTWITDGNGNWIDAVNWASGTLAYGTDKTANFTANITANRTVTLGADLTIGNITFTDSTTSSSDLVISGSNTLTLDVTTGTPVINVTQTGNRQLSINSVISGSDGLQKNGPGILNLGAANTYTGTTIINDGLLNFANINMDGFGGGPGSRDISVATNKLVQRTHSVLNAAFMKRLVETSNEFAICATASGAADVGTGNTLDFSSSANGANLPNAFFASFATNGGQCRFNGTIIPASDNYRIGFPGTNGALSMIQPLVDIGTPRGLIIGGGTPVLVADNTFTGDTVLRSGRLFLGRQLALQNSALNVGNGVDGNTGQICFLASNVSGATQGQLTDQPTLGGLIGSRNLLTIYNSGNQNNTTRLAATGVLGLTLDVDTGKTHTYSGNVRLATGMYLTKTGPGTQVLSGANDYTGATTINGGTLAMGANNVFSNSSNVSIGAATLNAATFTDTVGTLDVTGASVINLGAGAALAFANSSAVDWTGGTLNITGTFVSGASIRFGTTNGGLTSTQLALISINGNGAGTCTLDANGYLVGGSPYTSWSGGAAFGADSNGDGVKNGLAWVLGASDKDVSSLGLLPTIDNTDPTYFIFNYRRKDDANTDANTTIAAQYGTDLTSWTTAVHNGTTIIITPSDNFYGSSPGVDKVEVKIARSLAPGGKLFMRLNTVQTP